MLRAPHALHHRLDEDRGAAEVQRPPAAPAATPVVARAAPTAMRAAVPLAGPHPSVHHQTLGSELHVLDHRSLDTQQALDYTMRTHVVLRDLESRPSTNQDPSSQTTCVLRQARRPTNSCVSRSTLSLEKNRHLFRFDMAVHNVMKLIRHLQRALAPANSTNTNRNHAPTSPRAATATA